MEQLDSLNLSFMAKEPGPAWLPASASEARRLAYWGQWVALFWGILVLILGIIDLFTFTRFGFGTGWYSLIAGIVNLVAVFMLKGMFFDNLDAGRFKEARDNLLIWAVLTLILGVLAGVFLLFAYIKLNEVFQPNYQPYPAGQYQVAPPQQQPAQAPPPQPAPPAPAAPAPEPAQQPKHAEMVKCKKCGVQYPAFMRTCPNCNEPR
ncbi:MAG TPA: hypothetical protein VEH08_05650 [Methanomassiliicoccales archaeon]|nr:hypothetical protein [Methanomassiliicoccales archaeon]